VNPRQGPVLSILPAMLRSLLLFPIQNPIQANGGKGTLDPVIWLWADNQMFLSLPVGLTPWATASVRRLR
ncbi:LPS export ABC transporter permease LptF, partial [Salmonella enterica]